VKWIDVAVIGASLAGAACARVLAQRGVDAAAFDRDPFPRDRVCGGFLSPGAVDLLDELGVLEDVRRAGARTIHSAIVHVPGGEIHIPFRRPGLGVSRRTLDALVAGDGFVQRGAVLAVHGRDGGFRIELDEGELFARIVIDASGKLGRFARRKTSPEFGVQFYEPGPYRDHMEFWFFQDGYGGAVSVENDVVNSCFLIRKDALPRYLNHPGCRVTGPVSYSPPHTHLIAIGDAAGMIDPFCGEGMRHALDTGRLAASVVAFGLRENWSYETMRRRYQAERFRRWAAKRALARTVRGLLRRPYWLAAALRSKPERVLEWMWG